MASPVPDQAVLTELRKLLAALYPTESAQRRLAAEAQLTVGAIAFASSAYDSWHQILHHAKHNRGIEPLLRLARDEFPDHEQLGLLASGQASAFVAGGSFDWQAPGNGTGLLERAISGRASLVHVSHLALGIARARAVAKIARSDGGSGTGFLITGDRLLTNHHVLPDLESARSSRALFNYQTTAGGCDEPHEELPLEPERCFFTHAADDFTVVGVPPAAAARWGCLELKARSVRRGDVVNIIQHPGGGPKQMGLFFDVVAFVGAGRVQYLTDTLPGSSGAPVFDRNWDVVALHHSGGWLVEPGGLEKRIYYRNEGIAIDRLLEQLEHR